MKDETHLHDGEGQSAPKRDSVFPDEKKDTHDTEQQQAVDEPEVVIRLSSTTAYNPWEVRVNYRSGQYEPVPRGDYLLQLMTLPSRVTHTRNLPPGTTTTIHRR
ncbi:hypothetical protein Hamer_G012782, partial [Homarus americanus]